ncbi:MAG: SPOR domain-containing protein [Betaproteobacteria bacterium]|nr:SPOR domain-containing protein [Betaproteobacteria bacterium]
MSKFGKFDRNSDKGARGASRPQVSLKKSGGGTLLGVFIGLVIGVLLSFGVVWLLNKSPLPFQNKYEGAPRERPATPGGAATAPQTPAALPGKPGDKATERQRFDFYNILEGKQPAVPAAPAATPAPATGAPAAEARPAAVEVFFLQVGSFQKAADADNLKAKLALTGLDATVQEVNIPEKGSMHRVRVGPFRGTDEMNRARALLSQSGVQGTVIKQKE